MNADEYLQARRPIEDTREPEDTEIESCPECGSVAIVSEMRMLRDCVKRQSEHNDRLEKEHQFQQAKLDQLEGEKHADLRTIQELKQGNKILHERIEDLEAELPGPE